MDWKAIGQDFKDQRAERSEQGAVRRLEILALRDRGFTVEELTPTHFRVNGCLDLFPVRQKYHHIGLNKRGNWVTALGVAQRFLPRFP